MRPKVGSAVLNVAIASSTMSETWRFVLTGNYFACDGYKQEPPAGTSVYITRLDRPPAPPCPTSRIARANRLKISSKPSPIFFATARPYQSSDRPAAVHQTGPVSWWRRARAAKLRQCRRPESGRSHSYWIAAGRMRVGLRTVLQAVAGIGCQISRIRLAPHPRELIHNRGEWCRTRCVVYWTEASSIRPSRQRDDRPSH